MDTIKFFTFLVLFSFSQFANSEACTFNEALRALNNNNEHRATMLFKMALRDGDVRVNKWLKLKNITSKKNIVEAILSSNSPLNNHQKTLSLMF